MPYALSLVMLVPSRSRPDNIRHLLKACESTVRDSGTLIVVRVDDDDPRLEEYLQVGNEWTDRAPWVRFEVGPRLKLGPTLNTMAEYWCDSTYAIGFMGDDHRPRSDGWDSYFQLVLRKYPNGYGMVYGNDGLQCEKLPTAIVMTSNIPKTLGYFSIPGAIHLYLDNGWLTLGKRLKAITYLPRVVIEHVHPSAGKALVDDLYVEVNSRKMLDHDWGVYEKWAVENLENDVRTVQKRLGPHPGMTQPASIDAGSMMIASRILTTTEESATS
jgi:hypothetical protein